ncbi:hypothetical protein LY28_01559 [Ruminiclostridium sufflavum DSM 19573]|uniref:Permease n=1 Tax=Ruminiclostridium sufflavum DSM 19573 TaxID=1121337 RepID=A0A318XN05_9FIRM|nr:permease [Ruminiclostridium sufflavum]PYG88219.1 hypothetical protein LY28_01559 [Ruminiclostridium sufflavum DSM 19573]
MSYKNFSTAIFYNAFDLLRLIEDGAFESSFEFFSKHIDIGKIYLETYRSGTFLSEENMLFCKKHLNGKGVKVSGAITTTPAAESPWDFSSFCYSSPEQREKLKEVVAYTAGLFDEIILDDFYFTNCKCDLCIEAKGGKSWADFRTHLLTEVSSEIMSTAKSVNPDINMIIKYPNWYDHHQFNGYTPETQLKLFDSFYTGTETRDSQYTQQVLQRYAGYFIMRYFENINPGKNLGGWFDAFNCNLNAYAEQLYMTIFSKAKEITLFCAGLLAYDYKIFVPLAGFIFNESDKLMGNTGKPAGISCYKPFNSDGEDYLHGYLGMLGLPLEPFAEYPSHSKFILLTESAKKDPAIIDKIKASLRDGKSVMLTSGLLRALNKQLSDIAAINYTDKKSKVREFGVTMEACAFKKYCSSDKEILIPHIDFKTNDSWQRAVGIDSCNNHAILLENKYSKGKLYVLTIPDNPGDLYSYPEDVLNIIREASSIDMPVHLEAPSRIGLFIYDNDTFIVESFRETNTEFTIVVHKEARFLSQLESHNCYDSSEMEATVHKGMTYFKISLSPGAYKAFRIE